MFTRHIKKFNNAEEIQAAIEAGTLASPYIALDASSNTISLVYPQGETIPDIENEEEGGSSVPISMSGNFIRTFKGMYGNLTAQISLTATYNNGGNYIPRMLFVRKPAFDDALGRVENMTEVQLMASLFVPEGNGDTAVHPSEIYEAYSVYGGDYPWGAPITWISGKNWWNTSEFIHVPLEDNYSSTDNTYLILAAFCDSTTKLTTENLVYNLGTYTVAPGMTNNANVVWEGLQEYAVSIDHKSDPETGEPTPDRYFSIRVPANTLYDSAKYTIFFGEDMTAEQALANGSDVRDASVGIAQDFQYVDDLPMSLTNTSQDTKTVYVTAQLYNAATSAVLQPVAIASYYQDPE